MRGSHNQYPAELVQEFRKGDRKALAKIISYVEDHRPGFEHLLHEIYPLKGNAQRIGLTGPPGAGKSTLVERLIELVRTDGLTVGVIAVDPTSPFSGGALLGDRVRMSGVQTDPGVFIRSMATRGSLGGLSSTTEEVATVLDAFGTDILLIETVGVGQSELDIAEQADVTVVVVVPESGDAVQTLKAGLMEIADVLVVNKADRDGSLEMAQALEDMVGLRTRENWQPPVLRTIAIENSGVRELWSEIVKLHGQLEETGLLLEKRRSRIRTHLRKVVDRQVENLLWNRKGSREILDIYVARIEEDKETPYTASRKILSEKGISF
ncbi:MAG: methylmalonyl Co-A mutase-associated GTPase MeaB [Candidatus Glassbacteria bacterium]